MHPPAALHRNVQQENKASEREREKLSRVFQKGELRTTYSDSGTSGSLSPLNLYQHTRGRPERKTTVRSQSLSSVIYIRYIESTRESERGGLKWKAATSLMALSLYTDR